MSKQVGVLGAAAIVGGSHLKMTVTQPGSPRFDCIGFGLADYAEAINTQRPFDMCYTIEENVWRDKRNLQLNVKDIKIGREEGRNPVHNAQTVCSLSF